MKTRRGRNVSEPEGPRASPRRKAALSAEERELWSLVTRSITPLADPGRMTDLADDRIPSRGLPEAAPAKVSADPSQSPTQWRESRPAIAEAPSRPPPPPPPPATIDRRQGRKIAKGRIEIDARIDLHGMVQSAAHARLEHFIHSCHAQGLKTVLVITGKGGARTGGHQSQAEVDGDMFSERERGVLRRNVPRWLDEPSLRPLVVSYGPASVRHGGEGALYIVLRSGRGRA